MKNKVIIITGASKGLGLALAKYLSLENTVINISRTQGQNLNSKINFFECNLSKMEQIRVTLIEIIKAFPKIDLLINNAGIMTSSHVAVMNPEDISEMVDVNLKAPMIISRYLIRKMMQEKSGQIINILSMASTLNLLGDSVYAATKAGLETFSKILNKEGHPFGVHVNNIKISAFPSGMLDALILNDEKKILNIIPHKQYAPFSEIIEAIYFFEKNCLDLGGQTISFGGI